MTTPQEDRVTAVWDMLGAAVDGNAEEAARGLIRLGQESSTAEMYGVCCAMAEASAAVLRRMYPAMVWAPSSYLVGVVELEPGGLDADPVVTWAARFIAAQANHDSAQTNALFSAALANGADFYGRAACELLAYFGGLARSELHRRGLL